ncbi:MAG TPA: cyanophycinase [Bacteroidetes bacterium]|nr:cyanophycinase [Bacteroidota bacterium]
MLKFVSALFLFLFPLSLLSQVYTSWLTGDSADVSTAHHSGLILAGGGGDNDDAMRWMLNHAAGGDVVILRASGSDGYNNYFFSQLGVSINSVETLLLNSSAAANHAYVSNRIREAEVLFIAGGDQYDYYQYWKDSPVEDAINYLIHTKKATIGGTSAGMAILGKVYYTPPGSSVDSAEALGNPYHPDMNIIGRDDFVDHPLMLNTITDTHFDQRGRAGRTVTFLARMETDWGIDAFGIACNEYTAICIDSNGLARVFGDTPNYPDYAYFLQSNCAPPVSLPETCTSGQPLTWNKGGEAIKVYQVPGTTTGVHTFDLSDWRTGNGGGWENWHIANGLLTRSPNASLPCPITRIAAAATGGLKVQSNPFGDRLEVALPQGWGRCYCEVLDLTGRVFHTALLAEGNRLTLETASWPTGIYTLRVHSESGPLAHKKIVRQ